MFRLFFPIMFLFLVSPALSQTLPPIPIPPLPQPLPIPPHQYPQHPQQSEEEEKIVTPPPTRLVWEIRGVRPPDKNILFIVDTSGSMKGNQVQSAIQMAISIAEAPVDELQIAMISFGSSTNRWAGTTDIDPETGRHMSRNRWSAMPSKINLDAAYNWLQANKDRGGTSILPAVNNSFVSCSGGEGNERVAELSIIIISDGEIGNFDAVKIAINQHQEARIKNDLPPASIGFIGVDVRSLYDSRIKNFMGERVGEAPDKPSPDDPPAVWRPVLGSLGYCRIEYVKEEEEDE